MLTLGKFFLAGFLLAALWTLLIGVGFYRGWFLTSIAEPENSAAFSAAVTQKIDQNNFGNIAISLIEDGEVIFELQDSIGQSVSRDSIFQIASISKWVASWGALSLVEQGKLGLDDPVSRYLSRWQLPASNYDPDGVTVRGLLSHTAGLTSFGYFGFSRHEDLQTLEESLLQARDAVPPGTPTTNLTGVTRLVSEPGTEWNYTGAGYTLLQLLIEEVSGMTFSDYMQQEVLAKLGMRTSTFDHQQVPSEQLVEFYDAEGRIATHYLYTATAAASLYSSTNDLTRFVQAHLTNREAPPGNGIVSQENLDLARTAHGKVFGFGIYGLGTFRYASDNQGDVIFGHDGSNYPAINTAVRLNPTTGDGIIVFCTGNSGLASRLAGDWVLWNTGNADITALLRVHNQRIIQIIAAGWIVFALLFVYATIRYFRHRGSA